MFSRQPRTVVPSVVKASSMLPAKTSKMDMRLSARTLPELKIGDKVRLYKDKQWKVQGTIFEKCQQPRSYIVLTKEGRKLRRNRRHIKRADVKAMPDLADDSDSEDDIPAADRLSIQQENSNTHPQEQEPVPADPLENNAKQVVTRSGRVVRRPAYLHNYEP